MSKSEDSRTQLRNLLFVAVASLLVSCITVGIGIAIYVNNVQQDWAIPPLGFKFASDVLGMLLTVFGIALVLVSTFNRDTAVSFTRSLTIACLGLSLLTLSGLFAIAATLPVLIEVCGSRFCPNRDTETRE